MDAKTKASMQMDALEDMAEAWAEEVSLATMIKNATSPMDLNRTVPEDVRAQFRRRMEEQISAIAQQAFIEGAHRAVIMVNDAYKQAGLQISEPN